MYIVMNTAQIITNGLVYSELTDYPNVFTVDTKRLLEALPRDFYKAALYKYCICVVRNDKLPLFQPCLSSYFRPYHEEYSTYAIVLSGQALIE